MQKNKYKKRKKSHVKNKLIDLSKFAYFIVKRIQKCEIIDITDEEKEEGDVNMININNNKDINESNEEIKGKNNEISGKWNLIKELKEKFGEEDANDILEKSQEIGDDEKIKAKKIIGEIRKSLNKIIELKNTQQMNSMNFFKKIRKAVVRPKDLC